MNFLIKLIVGLSVFYACLLVIIYFKQGALLFFPDDTDFELSPEVKAFGFKALIIKKEGIELRYYEKVVNDPRALLIHFHGNGGAAAHRLSLLNELSDLPIALVAMEYPGYSNNSEKPGEEAFHLHANHLFKHLSEKYPKTPVYLFGESLGTGVATKLASENSIEGLILQHPYTAIVDMAKHHYPIVPSFVVTHKFLSRKWAPKVTAPVLILQGDQDQIIPLSNIKEQASNFKVDAKLVIFKGRGHNDLAYTNPDFFEAIKKFIFKM